MIALRASPQRSAQFLEYLRENGVREQDFPEDDGSEINEELPDFLTKVLAPIRDVVTRWNSTYQMLKRALLIRKGLDDITDFKDFRKFKLEKSEWKTMSEFTRFLKEFYVITNFVEGSKYPTLSSVVPLYNSLLVFLENWTADKKNSEATKEAAYAAIEKLTEYYEKLTPTYLVATVLDPRCKLQYFRRNGWENGDDASGGGNLIELNIMPA